MKTFSLSLIIAFTLQINLLAQDFWEEITTPLTSIHAFHCINETDMIMSGYNDMDKGLFVSDNGGATWQHLISYSCCYNYIGHYNKSVFAFVGHNLYKMNGLYDWQLINDADEGFIFLINDTTIIKGSWDSLEKSVDGGYTWYVVSTTPNEQAKDLVQYPNGDLFIGTYAVADDAIPGVYKSSDLGETWTRVGLNYHMPMALAVDSQGSLYAGSWGHYQTGMGGVYKSTDLGVTWDTLKLGIGVMALAITPGDTIFVGANNGVYMSTDLGSSWILMNTGMFYPNTKSLSIGGDGHLYATVDANEDRLYRSRSQVAALNIVQNPNELQMKLYPNPVNDHFTIEHENATKPVTLQVLNMSGKVVIQQRTTLPSQVLTEDLSHGVYLVCIQTENNYYTQRFIKN